METKPGVTLDENHVYHLLDGRTPKCVSNVLDLYFPFPLEFMPRGAAEMGTVRHEWFHALIQGWEMENEPAPSIAGSIIAFNKFISEVRPVYISGEIPYYDNLLDTCGKPDAVLVIRDRLSVVDWKPKTKSKRTKAQTAGYKTMLNRNGIPVLDRFELRLNPNGTYRLEKHEDDGDLKRWPALVAGYAAATFYK